MKNLLLLTILGFYSITTHPQCPGCVVDPTCTANPAAPALCPSTLPDAPVNEPYDLDVTFFMPQNFTDAGTGFDVTLGSITITSISGLPPGLSATVNETDNVYTITSDPASQRGCVKICGTPTTIGSYTISVNVIASVTSPISIDQAQSFTLPISVLPGGSGNSGFSISIDAGCDSLLTEFQALITSPTQPVEYTWDFGNGNTSTLANPEPQLYTVADTYTVTLETRLMDFILTSVNFTATGSNWCGDIEEWFCGSGNPDIYYILTIGGASSTSSSGSNSINFSQSGMNTVISGTAFSIQFYDEDNGPPFGSPDDNLGTAVIQVTGPGTYAFNTNEGNGSVTIGTQVGLSFTNTDSVTVNASPASPGILGTDTLFCEGDSAILTLPQAAFYQWSRDGIELLSANNDTLIAFDSGNYTAEIRSEQGCAAFSDTFTVQVEPYPYQPEFILNPITESFFYNPGLPYNWVWLLDGDTLAGTENATNYQPLVPGNYSIVASNGYCESYSDAVFFTNVGIDAIQNQFDAVIYPVPYQSGMLYIEFHSAEYKDVNVTLFDAQGKLLQTQHYSAGTNALNFNPGYLAGGMYFLQISSGTKSMMRKLPVAN